MTEARVLRTASLVAGADLMRILCMESLVERWRGATANMRIRVFQSGRSDG